MRHKVIEVRQEVFNHNEHEVSKRWTFEEGVRQFVLVCGGANSWEVLGMFFLTRCIYSLSFR